MKAYRVVRGGIGAWIRGGGEAKSIVETVIESFWMPRLPVSLFELKTMDWAMFMILVIF